MKELNDIIQAYDNAVLQNKQMALATVVKVGGSSYRRPGARMLVTGDGEITGAISGGCLEGDALRKAQYAMFQQKNKLEIYDTTDDEDNRLGVQLGCNGIVYILFEPINPGDENNPVNLLKKLARKRKKAVLITSFNQDKNAVQKGTCCFITEAETYFNSEDKKLIEKAEPVLTQETSIVIEDENNAVLYQFIPPSIQLVIVGAGNDAQPLTAMASLLGWDIIVVDGRPAYATQQRFPKANRISVTKPSDILSAVEVDEQTAIVLMTHNFNYDVATLQQLINLNCKYIGTLGPRNKLNKMVELLRENGHAISNDKLENIYGPVGLDIGAETSEEIALSIISEIKAVFTQRKAGMLKERIDSIHSRNLLS
jgi:xanthine/CO dehydrogenase XdhC/CoxF family maturation factor